MANPNGESELSLTMKKHPAVIVVGGGAAGILAALQARRQGASVRIVEKTDRLGTKILISGGGKCNVAHDGPLEDVIKAFRPNEARFIRPACYRLTNQQIIEMFTSRGLEVYTRPNGRVFPVHQTAKDVVAILEGYLEEAGVEIIRDCAVLEVISESNQIQGIRTAQGDMQTSHLVLSVGGSSYPKTGCTGDGWPWAKALGHQIVKVRAALAPVYLEMESADPRAGVSLRDVILKARIQGKEIARWSGDVLLTHRGLSGPCVLGITRIIAERFHEGPVTLEADLEPEKSFEVLSGEIQCWIQENPKKFILSVLNTNIPERIRENILEFAEIDNQPGRSLSKKLLNRLIENLKAFPLGTVRTVPLEKGEVVAGGVSLDEVDPQTMRSKICRGLYLCGEILDIAGPVGGYNLQAAFATGFVAGETAGQDALLDRS